MNGKTIVGDEEIAKEFNKYFSEVGKKLAEEIPDNDIDPLHYVNQCQIHLLSKQYQKRM